MPAWLKGTPTLPSQQLHESFNRAIKNLAVKHYTINGYLRYKTIFFS